MPWKAKDAGKHDHAANTPKRRRQWSDVANSILERTGSDARAIRGANSVVKKSQSKRSRKRR
jgi:hypothetical protein